MAVYPWLVFVHLLGVTGFLLAHGVTIGVALHLRAQRDPPRVRGLLDLSRAANRYMYAATAPLLVGGIWAGFEGDWWGHAWIWLSVGVFAAMTVAGVAILRPHYRRLRAVVGQHDPAGADLESLLQARGPSIVAAIAFAGLGLIVLLMVVKPC